MPHLQFARSQANLDFVKKTWQMSRRARNGVKICGFLYPCLHLIHSQLILKFEGDIVQLSPKCKLEKLAPITFYASKRCRDSMIPAVYIRTITKRYGISCKVARYIMIYSLHFGRRRGEKSWRGLLSGEKFCHTHLLLRKQHSSYWKPIFLGNLKT